MPDGSLRDFPNIPANAKVNVDGKPLGIHELQPGMKLQRTKVTSTTPVVTTIQTVSGKLRHVNPPVYVILTLENGDRIRASRSPMGRSSWWTAKKRMLGD